VGDFKFCILFLGGRVPGDGFVKSRVPDLHVKCIHKVGAYIRVSGIKYYLNLCNVCFYIDVTLF
jgi:hypothetical protein